MTAYVHSVGLNRMDESSLVPVGAANRCDRVSVMSDSFD
jgi:hypothetical protein